MNECGNPTCSATTRTTYCGRRCQLAMRNSRPGHLQLPDVWVTADMDRALRHVADVLGMDVVDLIRNAVERELESFGYDPDHVEAFT